MPRKNENAGPRDSAGPGTRLPAVIPDPLGRPTRTFLAGEPITGRIRRGKRP